MPSTVDVQPFITWHRARVLRRTGKAPARTTLRTKASKLRVCLDVAGLTSLDYQSWLDCYRSANGKEFVRPIRKMVAPMPTPAHGNPRPMGPMTQ